ncbi:D-alanine--D-alanine ligase [Reichenbachiella versicolor]|uniref:D-alanine--D-alanine ligase n=1 Tax=Reichenbachiella versicolor TaxID=1821036 RepID=UPI000D6DDAAB|nr:D-alanine--D-alanine ligase [Reichenbachiella versicolor]
MKEGKLNIGILFGGKSAEHEISLKSAKNVIEALDKNKFSPVLIGVDKDGKWLFNDVDGVLVEDPDGSLTINPDSLHVALVPQCNGKLFNLTSEKELPTLDAVFPVMHGPLAEDGTIQGLLKLANVPFVGADVLGASVGMDKEVMKRLLVEADLPIGKYVTVREHEERPSFQTVVDQLGLPCFVKPANLGSSVGINRVDDESQYQKALDEAFSFDTKIIIEEFIDGREVECAVLGNEMPKASVAGEISFTHSFYSYEAKYEDEKGFKIDIPAHISDDQMVKVRQMAIDTFQALECAGFGRVDVFLTKDDRLLVNEINTIPGFTAISMYPMLWEATGLSYKDLISELIGLAIDRFQKASRLNSSKSK